MSLVVSNGTRICELNAALIRIALSRFQPMRSGKEAYPSGQASWGLTRPTVPKTDSRYCHGSCRKCVPKCMSGNPTAGCRGAPSASYGRRAKKKCSVAFPIHTKRSDDPISMADSRSTATSAVSTCSECETVWNKAEGSGIVV